METRSFGASVLLVFQKYCLHFAQISNGNPASVVFERLLLNSTSTLAHIADRVSSKPNRKKQCLAFMKCFTYCSVPTTCPVLSETSFFFSSPNPLLSVTRAPPSAYISSLPYTSLDLFLPLSNKNWFGTLWGPI